MSTYLKGLPQLTGGFFLTDGGIESELLCARILGLNKQMRYEFVATFDANPNCATKSKR